MDLNQPALVLLVEDDPAHAELARRSLRGHTDQMRLVILPDAASAKEWLASNTPDLLISDLNLPDGLGTTFLIEDKEELPYPVVIMTSSDDARQAIETIKAGAFDYLVKSPEMFRELGHVIQRTIAAWKTYTERNQALRQLQENEARYRLIFENSPVGILMFNQDGIITECNDEFVRIIGSTRKAILGLNLTHLPDLQVVEAVRETLKGGLGRYNGDYHSVTADKITPIRAVFSPIIIPNGKITGGIGIVEDFTKQKRAELLQTSIYRIAEAANVSRDLDALYQEIHSIIQTLLPADNFYIALWDRTTDMVSLPYHVDQYDRNPGAWHFGRGLTEYVLRTGKPLLADPQVYYDLEKKGEVVSIGTPSVDWLGVPLKDTDQTVFGALVVQSYTEGVRYSKEDMSILEYVSSQIAIIIQKRRAEEAEHQQRLLAEALLDTTSALSSSLELEEVFNRILVNLEKLTPFDLAMIMLIEGEITKTVSVHGRLSDQPGIMESFNWQDLHTLKTIYKTGKPLLVNDTNRYPEWLVLDGSEWIRSYYGIPLISKGEVIGFLNLNSSQANFFNPLLGPSLQAFANQAANAIENARLYAKVQQLAILDELTGLYNRRGLSIFGKREVERAIRFNRDLSILFSDIDDFKMFNDRYSYATGDKVLQILASCLRSNLREIDVISRYGGDEFVALLPETNATAALEISQRVRNAVQAMQIGVNGTTLNISISCGVYTRQSADRTLEGLLEIAGERLHQAKMRGKNTVAAGDETDQT